MKTGSGQKQSASRQKRQASKKEPVSKKGGACKAKGAGASAKRGISVQQGAGATAPVVYQTLRERVDAVEANVGQTVSLKDFLKSNGWS